MLAVRLGLNVIQPVPETTIAANCAARRRTLPQAQGSATEPETSLDFSSITVLVYRYSMPRLQYLRLRPPSSEANAVLQCGGPSRQTVARRRAEGSRASEPIR
jgi:hypothetical protein